MKGDAASAWLARTLPLRAFSCRVSILTALEPPCCEEAQTSSSRGTAPRGPDGGDPRPSATSQHQPPEVGLRNLQMKVENTDEHNCWFMALHFGVVSYAATEHLLSLSSPTRELVFKGGRGRWLCVVALWLLVLGGRNLYHG